MIVAGKSEEKSLTITNSSKKELDTMFCKFQNRSKEFLNLWSVIVTVCSFVQIRIFPIALPSKVDNDVERVFNGYKKKYVDKVLCEFITR